MQQLFILSGCIDCHGQRLPGAPEAISDKLKTNYVLRSTQPPTPSKAGNQLSLYAQSG